MIVKQAGVAVDVRSESAGVVAVNKNKVAIQNEPLSRRAEVA